MTMLSVCLVFCASFGLIQTVPVNYNDIFYANYDSDDYNEIARATRNLISKPGSEALKPLEEADGYYREPSIYREDNDFVPVPSLPSDDALIDPLPRSSYFSKGVQPELQLEYDLINQNLPPNMWDGKYVAYGENDYNNNQGMNMGILNSEVSPYEVDLYPFVHTSLSAAMNPVPPVHTLPPVYATHVHESLPSLEARGDYDIDVLNPENSGLMLPNLRMTRSRRDFDEELTRDRMMNNILPTMAVPFVRAAEKSSYQVPVSRFQKRPGQMLAVYPKSAGNCAIPLLLRCSPNIVRGTLSNTYAEQSPAVVSAASGAPYRESH